MCHQFSLPTLKEITQYLQNDLNLPLVQPKFESKANEIFPAQKAPVLLYQNDQLILSNKSWGYPSPKNGKPLFNARIERFYEQRPSMWDNSFAKQRCLIIAKQFYEYSKISYKGSNGKKYHDKYSFSDSTHSLTLIAGIYDQDHFAMVTTNPNSDMSTIHDRMPLVILPSELRQWLFQNFTSLINRENIQLNIQKQERKN